MAQLSLRTRRARARGISDRTGSAWSNRLFYPRKSVAGNVPGNRATLQTAVAGANNDLFYYAKVPGVAGNAITVAYVIGGTVPVVSTTGSAITVTAPASATAKEVARAVRFHPIAGGLVHVQSVPGDDGNGVIAAMAATSLTGATATL